MYTFILYNMINQVGGTYEGSIKTKECVKKVPS